MLNAYYHYFISNWLDALWIPVALFAVHKGQKLKALFFVLVCMGVLRLQVEVMRSINHASGFTGLIGMDAFKRGMIVYAVFILFYLAISWYSPGSRGAIYLAASMTIFFAAFLVSSLAMLI